MNASEAAVKNRGGRPRVTIKPHQVHQLRSQGMSWRRIAKVLGIGTATAMRLLRSFDGTRLNTQDRYRSQNLRGDRIGLQDQTMLRRMIPIMGIIGRYVMWTLPRKKGQHQAEKRREYVPRCVRTRGVFTFASAYGCGRDSGAIASMGVD